MGHQGRNPCALSQREHPITQMDIRREKDNCCVIAMISSFLQSMRQYHNDRDSQGVTCNTILNQLMPLAKQSRDDKHFEKRKRGLLHEERTRRSKKAPPSSRHGSGTGRLFLGPNRAFPTRHHHPSSPETLVLDSFIRGACIYCNLIFLSSRPRVNSRTQRISLYRVILRHFWSHCSRVPRRVLFFRASNHRPNTVGPGCDGYRNLYRNLKTSASGQDVLFSPITMEFSGPSSTRLALRLPRCSRVSSSVLRHGTHVISL